MFCSQSVYELYLRISGVNSTVDPKMITVNEKLRYKHFVLGELWIA